jgi:hypothetical protein
MRFGERTRSGTSVSGWTKRASTASKSISIDYLLVSGGGGARLVAVALEALVLSLAKH